MVGWNCQPQPQRSFGHRLTPTTSESNNDRRISQFQRILASSLLAVCISWSSQSVEPAVAATAESVKIETSSYSINIPSSWKVINRKSDSLIGQNGVLLSVLDPQGGSTVSVVREQACPASKYFEQPKLCDLVLPKDGVLDFSSQEVTEAIVKKMVIRRDDRDNAALGAEPTSLDQISRLDDHHVDFVGSTSIPTGAVKKDAIGRTVQESIVRVAKMKTSIQELDGEESPCLLSVWVSAPLDEWQKPLTGIRLQQVVDSVTVE